MNRKQLYQEFTELVQAKLPSLGAWQAKGLSLMSMGISLSEKSKVTKIAEELGFAGRLSSVEKRLKRWLKNERIEMEEVWREWIKWLWSAAYLERAILLVDETKIGERIGAMVISLAYHQRAIPLIWTCYVANNAEAYPSEGQVGMIVRMLDLVMSQLPEESQPLIQADRGIGCSSDLIKACQARGWYYLFRIQKSSLFSPTTGGSKQVRDWVEYGEVWTNYGTLFSREERYVQSYVFLAWESGQKEAWHLASNDPTINSDAYAKRMWQELSFKDFKSAGWQWQGSLLEHPERVSRLILAMSLAYAWMLTQGTFVLHSQDLIREICDADAHKYSAFRAGLRFLKQRLDQLENIFVGLFLVPSFMPLPETVPR